MIYICIPAHNEERTIGVLLWKIRQVLADFPRDYQLLVANDGSTDSTAEVLAPYQRVLPLTVFQSHKQRGYATALEQLIREAVRRAEYPKRDVIITLQGDFTEDPDHITAMMKRIEAGADLVCANQELPATATRAHRWTRKISGYLIGRRKWPEGVTDPLSGFRAYRVMTVKRAIEARSGGRLLSWNGALANAELLMHVAPHSRRTDCVDVSSRSDRQQRTSRQALWPMVKAMMGFARGASGPMANTTLETPENVQEPRARRRGRHPLRHELLLDRTERPERTERGRGPRPRRAEGRGEEREEPRGGREPQRTGENGRRRGPRAERVDAGEKVERKPRPAGEPRPERKRRERPPKLVAPTAEEGVEGLPPLTDEEGAAPARKKRRRRRRRGGTKEQTNGVNNGAPETVLEGEPEAGAEGEADASEQTAEGSEGPVKRRRRSRRGRGRRGRKPGSTLDATAGTEEGGNSSVEPASPPEPLDRGTQNSDES